MFFSTPSRPEDSSLIDRWKSVAPYAAPPIAAATAIIPAMPGYITKTALQLEQAPKLSLTGCLRTAFKAAPTIGVIVGTQMIAQPCVERRFQNNETGHTPEWAVLAASSTVVGAASAPMFAVFNGQTMGWSPLKSLRKLCIKQAAYISCKEVLFVGGIQARGRVREAISPVTKTNRVADAAAGFIGGAIGTGLGHPADTALTRTQAGLPTRLVHLWRGCVPRFIAGGVFGACFATVCHILNPEDAE
ncbi:hypothetical protein SCG7086_AC_00060 [Chlamydiales bacterium SCGC AG-110-P3]|nr:hypothetical protein SCG7086_AC_00060 [Chlamydiales bacterium SCGC AG-110-P3]